MAHYNSPPLLMPGRRPLRIIWLAILGFALLFAARWTSQIALQYAWWKELNQLGTWFNLFLWDYAPTLAPTLFAFAVLWLTHHRAMHFAAISRREHRNYVRLTSLLLLALAWIIAASSFDSWTVARFF